MKKFSTLLLICFSLASFAQYPIGHKSINFKDASRTGGFAIGGGTTNPVGGTGRDIGTEIYYPATSAGNNTPVAVGNFPVIVFGHGFSMTWDAYTTLWDSLVNSGYIICFPRTESGLLPAPSHLDLGKDLAKVADLMLAATSPLAGSTTNRLAIGGHSMGGGATFLADQYTTSPICYFTFAAAETNPKASSAAKTITKPNLLFSGTLDCVAPNATHQQLMYDSLASACKTHINLTGGYHCEFADNNFNCGFGEGTCITAGGLSSAEEQRRVRMYLNPYLDYYLKGVCAAWFKFQNLIDTATIATVQQSCNNNVPQNASISGNNYFCNGSSTTLTANPSGFNYLWSNSATTDSISVSAIGNYSLTVSNGVCSVTTPSSMNVVAHDIPTLGILYGTDTVCLNSYFALNFSLSSADNADSIVWSASNPWNIIGGQGSSVLSVNSYMTSGSVSVYSSNECGTTSTLSFDVVYVDTPQITITQQDSVLSASSTGAASYQWYNSGALISGANNADYKPNATGNYTVSITNQYGCSTQSAPFSFIYTALNEVSQENSFRIFPNPNSTNHLQFSVEKDWLGSAVKIIDATGRLISKHETVNAKFEIELLNISSGVYIVSMEKGTQVLRKKLIVE